jgi:hypothetical protein
MRVGDGPVLEVEHVLTEVPDGSVVGLGVEVVRDLVDTPVEVGDVLGDERLDLLALPLDNPGVGQQRDLGPKRLAINMAQ